MKAEVEVTWEDGKVEVYTDIPANQYERLGEDKVRKILERQYGKGRKIKSLKRLAAQSGSQTAPNSSRDDRDATSQTSPAAGDSRPKPQERTRHDRPEPGQDYSKDFPDKYTPPGMRRNRWGELIWE